MDFGVWGGDTCSSQPPFEHFDYALALSRLRLSRRLFPFGFSAFSALSIPFPWHSVPIPLSFWHFSLISLRFVFLWVFLHWSLSWSLGISGLPFCVAGCFVAWPLSWPLLSCFWSRTFPKSSGGGKMANRGVGKCWERGHLSGSFCTSLKTN